MSSLNGHNILSQQRFKWFTLLINCIVGLTILAINSTENIVSFAQPKNLPFMNIEVSLTSTDCSPGNEAAAGFRFLLSPGIMLFMVNTVGLLRPVTALAFHRSHPAFLADLKKQKINPNAKNISVQFTIRLY